MTCFARTVVQRHSDFAVTLLVELDRSSNQILIFSEQKLHSGHRILAIPFTRNDSSVNVATQARNLEE